MRLREEARIAITALATAVALVLSSSASPTPPGRNGLIAFVHGIPLAWGGIAVVRADGSGLRELTHHPRDRSPAWSPDGRFLAFERQGRIYVMKADGTGLHRVGHRTLREHDPAWSPGGRAIAFVTARSLFVMRTNGSRVRRLYRMDRILSAGDAPAWSPDGRSIAFTQVDHDACQASALMVIGRDGRGLRTLTVANGCFASIVAPGADGDEVDADDSDPDWSPDGTRIAFTRVVWLCGSCDQEEIFSSHAEGNDAR